MIKYLTSIFFSAYSITPVVGDKLDITTPGPLRGSGSAGLQTRLWVISKRLEYKEKINFPRLPDISKFEIILGYFNPLLLAFGLSGRLPAQIITEPGRNGRINRYLLHMKIKLLESLPSAESGAAPEIFWHYSWILITRSNAYASACMHYANKNLYREVDITKLNKIMSKVDELRGRRNGRLSVKMEYHRSYIPKGESWRPLGVPTIAWRIYGAMLTFPLVIFTNHLIGTSQHGFRPGRGTLTAWKTLLSDVIKSDNIWEFDLKQCFPSISLPRLGHRLEKVYNLPEHVARFFESLNYTPPSFRGPIKLNESQSLAQHETAYYERKQSLESEVEYVEGWPKIERLSKNTAFWSPVGKVVAQATMMGPATTPFGVEHFKTVPGSSGPDAMMAQIASQMMGMAMAKHAMTLPPHLRKANIPIPASMKYDSPSKVPLVGNVALLTTFPPEVLNAFLHSLSVLPFKEEEGIANDVKRSLNTTSDEKYTADVHNWVKLIGTAQGSPLSPYLAAIALDELSRGLPEGVKLILYADDGLLYGPGVKDFVLSGQALKYFRKLGFVVHSEKSGMVRTEGVWEKDLKFLGLTYDGVQDQLRASTRKGATLVFNQHGLLEAEVDIDAVTSKSPAQHEEAVQRQTVMAINYERLARIFPKIYWFKSKVAFELISYYLRLFMLRLQFGPHEVFALWYYILLTRLFYMAKDNLIRTLASGVLALRSREKVAAYIRDNFTPEGLPQSPSAYEYHGQPGRSERSNFRMFRSIFQLFKYSGTSGETAIAAFSPASLFPWFSLRSRFIMETGNHYLSKYRSKYTWANFVKSKFAGYLMSRLYNNVYSFGDIVQDFSFKHVSYSLASFYRSRFGRGMTVFIGTSCAGFDITRRFRRLQTNKKLYWPLKSARLNSSWM